MYIAIVHNYLLTMLYKIIENTLYVKIILTDFTFHGKCFPRSCLPVGKYCA